MSHENEWVTIPNFPKYSVNRLGQVRHDRIGRFLRPQVNQNNTAYVCLVRDWEQKKRSLALLVASAFIPQDREHFDTPINLDGDRLNCAVDNLMWRPRWFAIRYHQQFTVWPRSFIKVPLRQLDNGEVFRNSREVAVRYGLLEDEIFNSIQNRTYVWPTWQQFDLAE